jgi:hypothetical protein
MVEKQSASQPKAKGKMQKLNLGDKAIPSGRDNKIAPSGLQCFYFALRHSYFALLCLSVSASVAAKNFRKKIYCASRASKNHPLSTSG